MRSRRSVPLLLSCAAVVLAGCGGSSLLDGDSASELQASLSRVRTAIDDGQCSEARTAAKSGAAKVDTLPTSVDSDLRDNLKTAFQDLSARVDSDCDETSSQPTSTTQPATPTTTTTDTTEPSTTTTEPDDTTPLEPTTPDTQPTDPTTTGGIDPTDPTDPGDDDGSGGVTPGVDGPAAGQRSVPDGKDAVKELRQKLKDARKQAEDSFRGRGPG
ncbi:hypothetical protein AB0L40_10400 [Patulibacter sp. NPDC049589]|uniref:hypothetical protein n=1 Tax=Patulibacter sp. NPDC049589 TaxID=3154731 RepID=UPI00342830A0